MEFGLAWRRGSKLYFDGDDSLAQVEGMRVRAEQENSNNKEATQALGEGQDEGAVGR